MKRGKSMYTNEDLIVFYLKKDEARRLFYQIGDLVTKLHQQSSNKELFEFYYKLKHHIYFERDYLRRQNEEPDLNVKAPEYELVDIV